ncbi:type VI secretion system-associated protein TagF [Rhizobium laguerreae]|uniref:type VI secretion system-associated protein TagF n=1 Tax=Rhizobium laguerreae TaxID=1076926 RepID=UPI001C9131B5|nr:type VI secretion system-associated protein TagF [Rhizobium laguerreae]MBY3453976.1 type VI secretion system-associated protein TagF [Rhizobium laguerreae]MBY3461124.1 type VI secretion system-associated protein TagF [Rhizobium laguerreae]
MPVGLYGKYPAKRDFLAINLPRAVMSTLETWLQAGLAISKERLGSDWHGLYSIHPIWNFKMGADILGTEVVGSIMPSVDASGRFFPLVILAHAQAGSAYPPASAIQNTWFVDVHRRLLSALSENDIPGPDRLLADLGEPSSSPSLPSGMRPMDGGFRMGIDPAAPSASLEQFEAGERQARGAPSSTFWTTGGQFVAPQIISTTGLPDPEIYSVMIGGWDGGNGDRAHVPADGEEQVGPTRPGRIM